MNIEKYLGIGLRPAHYADWKFAEPDLWVEVMSDNYIAQKGGPGLHHVKESVRSRQTVLHGVGLNIAGVVEVDYSYLEGLQELIELVHPRVVSDHLCFTRIAGRATYDLLPFSYTAENLRWVAHRVNLVQMFLNRRMSFENLSRYVRFSDDEMSEIEFLAKLCNMTGCGILLDVNNVIVSSFNLGTDPKTELAHLQGWMITQYHVAGHTHRGDWLHDTHDAKVTQTCWSLLGECVSEFGLQPIILENDDPSTPFQALKEEIFTATDFVAANPERVAPPRALTELQNCFIGAVYTPPWEDISEQTQAVRALDLVPSSVPQLDVYRQCFFARITNTLSETILAPLSETFGSQRVQAWLANYALEKGYHGVLLQDNLIGIVDYLKGKQLQSEYPGLHDVLDLCLANWHLLTSMDHQIQRVDAEIPLRAIRFNPSAVLLGGSSDSSGVSSEMDGRQDNSDSPLRLIFRSSAIEMHTLQVPSSCNRLAKDLSHGMSLAEALEREEEYLDVDHSQTVQDWLTALFRSGGLVARHVLLILLCSAVVPSAWAGVWNQQAERLLQVSSALLDDTPAGVIGTADLLSFDVGTAVSRIPKIDSTVGSKQEGVPASPVHAVPQLGMFYSNYFGDSSRYRFALRGWFGFLPEQASVLVLGHDVRFRQKTQGLEIQFFANDRWIHEGIGLGMRTYLQKSSAGLHGQFSTTIQSSADDSFETSNTQGGVSLFALHHNSGIFLDLLSNIRSVQNEFYISEDKNRLTVADGFEHPADVSAAGGMSGQISLGHFVTPQFQWGASQLFIPLRLSVFRLFMRYQKSIFPGEFVP